ncbi:MAG: ribonuclease HII [Bacillota bacterium]|mgnify:FL=1|nr:MAG: ribonuclease HII [Bacillota bacterium]
MKKENSPIDKLFYEREMTELGAQYIAGVDEVGRGPFAGPVVCAAVILPLEKKNLIEGIDDSKKLKEGERERLAELIKERAIAYKICEVDNKTIDRINILQATKLCMKQAVEGLAVEPDVVFVDGNFKIDITLPQQTLIKGDALSYSIGAASILAKVYRDRLMCEFDKIYPQYGFAQHKGYGTKMHRDAIREYGLCEIHRRTFIKNHSENTEKDGQ